MSAKPGPAATLYPASEKQAGRIATPGGRRLGELTLERLLAGEVSRQDMGITPAALRLQAEVARDVGRDRLATNFLRGAELAAVPQEEIFAAYELLRPGRAKDKQALRDLAERYRKDYGATEIAQLIEDAAEVYERRNLFRKRY